MSSLNHDPERQLSEALAMLASATRHVEAPSSVESSLLVAFRRRKQHPTVWRAWVAAALAAAVALLLLWPAGRPASAPSPQPQVATDFFPLRNGPLLDPDELAQVFRVRVPRDTMLQFGLPPESSGPGRTIQADLLVGQDGMARAIRFVK